MHATHLLFKRIQQACQAIHQKRMHTLFKAVEALTLGRRLSLVGLGRALLSAALVKHSIKRMDRLLGNEKLYAQRCAIYQAQSRLIVGMKRRLPLVIDWSDLTADRGLHLLRASVPVGGRALTVYEEVHPMKQLAKPAVHRRFLRTLKHILPVDCQPIVITDAGFRAPWFKMIEALGWDWIARIRNRDLFRFPGDEPWRCVKSLYAQANTQPQCLGAVTLIRSNPIACYFYLVRQRHKGRMKRNRLGHRAQSKHSQRNAQREREPWLIATSLGSGKATAKKIVKYYQMRMQIEEAFRDMKNARLGFSLSESQTKTARRFEILLLIGTLATLAMWLVGKTAELKKYHYQFQANTTKTRAVLSTFYLGCQVLLRNRMEFTHKELQQSIRALHTQISQEVFM